MSTETTGKKAKPKPLKAEQFAEWVERPENANKWFELVRGEVIELPPPTRRHGVVTNNAGRLLGNYTVQRKKGYVAGNDSGVILERDPDTVRGPDVALYEDAGSFDELHPKYGEVPPRVGVEVLSPNDRADRVLRKITEYLKSGVDLVWLVDPEARTIVVYRRDKAPYLLEEHEELTAEDVLPGFRCRVADFFFVPGQPQEPKPRQTRKPRRKE
jgi:Uma2 family endonuclease